MLPHYESRLLRTRVSNNYYLRSTPLGGIVKRGLNSSLVSRLSRAFRRRTCNETTRATQAKQEQHRRGNYFRPE
jgi:hypothetical protein